MPVSGSVEPGGRFVVPLPTDPATIEEWRTAMLEVLAAPIARPHLAMLVDRRHAQAITKDFVVQMTGFSLRHHSPIRVLERTTRRQPGRRLETVLARVAD